MLCYVTVQFLMRGYVMIPKVPKLVIFIPLMLVILFLVSSSIYLYFQGDIIGEHVRKSIVEHVDDSYGISIEIGQGQIFGLSTMVFHDIDIDMQPDISLHDGIKTIYIPKITVHFNPLHILINREQILESIRTINVNEPHIVFRADLAELNPRLAEDSRYALAEESTIQYMMPQGQAQDQSDGTVQPKESQEKSGSDNNSVAAPAGGFGNLGQIFPEGFSTTIIVNDGTAEWLAMIDDTLIRVEDIFGISGTIKMGADLPIDIDYKFRAKGDKDAEFHAKGAVSMFSPGISNMYVDFYNLDVTYVQEKGLDFHGLIEFSQGKLHGNMVASLDPGKETNVRGTAEFLDGKGYYDFFEGFFTNVYADLDFSLRSANIKKLTAQLHDIKLELTGRVSNFHDPIYDMMLTSQSRGIKYFKPMVEALDDEFPIDGNGEITVGIKGPADALVVSGKAELHEGTLLQYRLEDISAYYTFADDVLAIDTIEGSTYSGDISGEALFDLSTEGTLNYMIDLQGHDMSSYQLLNDIDQSIDSFSLADYSVSGLVSGNIIIRTDTEGIPVMTGSVKVNEGNISDFEFDLIEAGFWGEYDKVILDYLSLASGDGKIHLRGIIDDATGLKLDITAEKILAEKFLSSVGVSEVQGLTSFVGNITGAFENPKIDGTLRVVDGAIYGQDFDELIGQVVFSNNELGLNDINIYKGSMSHNASGTIVFTSTPRMSLNIITRQAKIKDLLDMGQLPLDIRGDLSGNFNIQGYIHDIIAEGNVSLSNASLLGQSLDQAELDFRLEDGKIYFKRFSGLLNGSRVQLSGILGDNDIDLSYNIDEYDINEFPVSWLNDGHYEGIATASGKISGDVSNPKITGNILSDNFIVGDYGFDSVRGAFLFQDERLSLTNLDLKANESTYSLDGFLAYENNHINDTSMVGRFSNADVHVLTSLLDFYYTPNMENIVGQLSGTISGEIQLALKDSINTSSFRLYSADLSYRGVDFDNIFVNGNIEEGYLDVESMRIVKGEGFLDLNGSISMDGNIDISAQGYSLEVLDLMRLIPIDQSITGTVDFEMDIHGTIANPIIDCNFNASKGSLQGVEYQVLSGNIILEENILHFNDTVGYDSTQSLKITGSMPIPGISDRETQLQDRMDLYVKSDNANLGLISLFVPDIEYAQGDAEVYLHITSGLKDPVVNGYVSLQGGIVKHKYVEESLRDIQGDVLFENNNVNVGIKGIIEKEGVFDLTGTATLEDLKLQDLDFHIKADGIRIVMDAYDGYIDGLLNVKGHVLDLFISGTLDIYNGSITLMEPEVMDELPINPRLEITARVGKGVSLKGPGIDVPVYGQLNLRGTLGDPTVRGRINANRGYFEVFGTRFSVNYGAADFFDLTGYIPRVSIRGLAKVSNTEVMINVDGRPDNLQINLQSDPPKTTEEILSLLAWPGAISQLLQGDVEGVVQDQLIGYVDSQIHQLLSETVSDAVQDAFDLDEFLITSDTMGKIELEAGKYLSDNIYLGYTRKIKDIDIEEIWDIEYGVTSYFNVGASVKQDGEIKVGFEAKFDF